MKLFKKHYEKFIFILFLVLFVVLFGIQTHSVLSEQDERPEEKLDISLGHPDYKSIDFNDKKFRADTMFSEVSKRVEPGARKENLNIDLLVPPVLAKCPQGAHLIPVTDFPGNEEEKKKAKCSFCDLKLEDIPLEKLGDVDAEGKAKDSDNDGIPDVEERKLGLNPNNESDAGQDKDEDGFTNLEEYRANTDINNPKSRPPYSKKLYVKEVEVSNIGIQIVRITGDTGKNEDDPSKWTVYISYNMKDKRGNVRVRSARLRIGRELKNAGNNGDDFLLEKIEKKFGDLQGRRVNQSTIYLKRVKDGLLHSAKVGEIVLDPNKVVTYEIDLPFMKEKEIKTVIGKQFKLGNETTVVDTYVTLSADKDPRAERAEDRMRARVQNTVTKAVDDIKTRQNVSFDGMSGVMPDQPNANSMPRF